MQQTTAFPTMDCTGCSLSLYVVLLGMRDAVSADMTKSAAVVVRNLFQPILDVARIQAKTVTKGTLNNDKANGKRKVRLVCAAAVQFRRTRRWEALFTICVEEGGMNHKRVGADYGVMFVGSGGTTLPSRLCMHGKLDGCPGGGVGRLRECSIRMGKAQLVLEGPKLLWSHVWIDHMYFFARKWRILSKISCFAHGGGGEEKFTPAGEISTQ